MTREIFKPIKGYEGLYEVSNLGNVKSLFRKVESIRNGLPFICTYYEKLLKQQHDNKGYLRVKLQKDGNKQTCKVHRLVAETFIGDITNKEIDHINTIKDDNRVENLRIVTSKENSNNPIAKQKNTESHKKKVKCITPNGDVYLFNGIVEAERKGFGKGCSISQCLHGYLKTYRNNRWEFITKNEYKKLNFK